MHRAQILLEKAQYDTLKALGERAGISVSHLVRDAVALYLRTDAGRGGPGLSAIEGIGSDAKTSGRHHDAHLYPRRPRR